MERPQYANAFSVTYNPKLQEVVINFVHEYPVLQEPEDNVDGHVKVQATSNRDNVCGVVLPAELAQQLREIIGKSMQESNE